MQQFMKLITSGPFSLIFKVSCATAVCNEISWIPVLIFFFSNLLWKQTFTHVVELFDA